jgi:regulator of sigma E protease
MTLLIFLFSLGILILFHEFGHFFASRRVGLKVEEFSIGFPPRIFSKRINGTLYSLGAIFFGGFVKLKGEDDPNDPEGFLNLKPYKKFIIAIAGVVFNIILAYIFIFIGLNIGYPIESNKIIVSGILNNNSQAAKYFQIGDQILYVQKDFKIYKFNSPEELYKFLIDNKNKEVKIFYIRDNKTFVAKVVPPVGFYLTNFQLQQFSITKSFILAFKETYTNFKNIVIKFIELIYNFLKEGKVHEEIVGPVGIYNLFYNFKNFGLGYLLYFLALLSLNLAFINILPLPALDGGRAVVTLFEMITQRKVDYKKEEFIHQIGFLFLFFLLILITIKDIYKLWLK